MGRVDVSEFPCTSDKASTGSVTKKFNRRILDEVRSKLEKKLFGALAK